MSLDVVAADRQDRQLKSGAGRPVEPGEQSADASLHRDSGRKLSIRIASWRRHTAQRILYFLATGSNISIGPLAIGNLKYKAEFGLFRTIHTSKEPALLDFPNAYAFATAELGQGRLIDIP
jgi:hypothetical protein